MTRLGFGVIVLMAALLVPGLAQDRKDDKKGDDPPVKLKGQLPQGYGKLKLSDEQKQRIYKIQATYKAKLDDLEKQKKKLQSDRKKEYEKVLTKDQLQKLREDK